MGRSGRRIRWLALGVVAALTLTACGRAGTPGEPTRVAPPPDVSTAPETVITADASPVSPASAVTSGSQPGLRAGSATPGTIALFSTATLVACPVASGDQFTDLKQYKAELACTMVRFQWPPGYVPDLARIYQALDTNDPTIWQGGYSFTFWSAWNVCAWYLSWLEARRSGNADAERTALAMITDVTPNYPRVITGFPAGAWSASVERASQDIANKAALGDPSGVQQYLIGNCGSYLVWQGKA